MKLKFNQLLGAFLLNIILFSCSNSDPEQPLGAYEQGVLIMNEGNFGTNDGEIYHLDPITLEVKKNVFESENLRPFAGLLEDMVPANGNLYLVSNTGKVEIVDAGTFKSLGAVSGGLDQPRSLAVVGSKLFISDYGPYDASYGTPDSYVAVVDGLNGGVVSKKIKVSNKPEDLIAYGKYIFVAGSEKGKVEIIDAEKEEVIKVLEVDGNPSQFFESDGRIWLYSTGKGEVFFQSFHMDNLTKATTSGFPLANATGRIAFGKDNYFYLLTSTGWPDYVDGVAKISIIEPDFDLELVSGSGLYGIGFDKNRDELYVANSNGFQGNGTITVYNLDGSEIRSFDVGRGPSGFLFY
jgi:DNA-binding beta-propeller fold protein YncE